MALFTNFTHQVNELFIIYYLTIYYYIFKPCNVLRNAKDLGYAGTLIFSSTKIPKS